jgi:hypothetical protein
MTLGAAAVEVRDRVLPSGTHQVEPDPAEMAARYGAERRARLARAACLFPRSAVVDGSAAYGTEESLYEPIVASLRSYWPNEKRLEEFLCEVTARLGRRQTFGTWSRPDMTMMQSCASAAKLRAAGPLDPSAYRACRVRALGLRHVNGLRQRTSDAVEAGPVFIRCRHLDSPNRAGRLPTAHCVRANALSATQHREAITVLPNFSDLGLSAYPGRPHACLRAPPRACVRQASENP